ncbi:hypothetical protein [Bartonella jaculi]
MEDVEQWNEVKKAKENGGDYGVPYGLCSVLFLYALKLHKENVAMR